MRLKMFAAAVAGALALAFGSLGAQAASAPQAGIAAPAASEAVTKATYGYGWGRRHWRPRYYGYGYYPYRRRHYYRHYYRPRYYDYGHDYGYRYYPRYYGGYRGGYDW